MRSNMFFGPAMLLKNGDFRYTSQSMFHLFRNVLETPTPKLTLV